MKYTSLLRLATAFVAFSISAQAAEVFKVTTVAKSYPVAVAADFNGSANDIYNNVDDAGVKIPDVGNANGMSVTTNFNGDSSAVLTGFQKTQGSQTTTYFGPKFYAGANRDSWHVTPGVCHNDGNGYRIKASTTNAGVIEGNGGNPLNTIGLFLFDADQSGLSGADDNLIFSDTDTLTAKLSVPGTMGPNGNSSPNRASLATYRAMVKAKGPNDVTAQYYAGTLYTVDLAALPSSSTVFNMLENAAAATWTLMPNIESTDDSYPVGVRNLAVDTSASATTVPGKFLTNITQVGFLLETDTNENSGGYNYGVREFIANATPASADHPIEWSQNFASPVNGTGTFLTTANNKVYDGEAVSANLLTGFDHAYKWSTSGGGLTATPTASTVIQENNQVVLDVKSRGDAGMVELRMIGPGTDNARRVRPPSHEVTFEIDLIEWRSGEADLLLQTRGHDGYVRSVISPSGNVKFTTWMSDYTHKNFNNFSGPSKLRNNNNNPGIVIVDGGTFDPASADPVEITISGNAEGTVNMNTAGDAVESVTLSNYGSGYTAEPTVTFAGGGMTVAPTISFNYSTGNINRGNVVTASMRDIDQDGTLDLPGTLLNDGQVLTYIQSYDNADDSISYYYSLDGSDPQFITKLTAADHSPGGHGFFDISTGNKWGQPNNQDAVFIQYKGWGTGTNADGDLLTAKLGINSITVATSDDDRDGVINRNDALPNNPLESVDSDSDGVGDNSDAHPGYNDSVISAGITQAVWDASQTALATAEADLTTAQAALANSLTLSEVQDLRAGSTMIAVSGGSATVSLQMEESSDLSSWSNLGAAVPFTVTLDPSDVTKFYRVKLAD